MSKEKKTAGENRKHFATPPLTIPPRNDVWETSAEILMTHHYQEMRSDVIMSLYTQVNQRIKESWY